MAGIKPASIVRFFETRELLSDEEIVARLKDRGIAVNPYGPGGYPTEGVFHLADIVPEWIGSRLDDEDGILLAFFGKTEDDPIFAAVNSFALELTDKKRVRAEIDFIAHPEALEMNEKFTKTQQRKNAA